MGAKEVEGEEGGCLGAGGSMGELGLVVLHHCRFNVIKKFRIGREVVCKQVEGGEGEEKSVV